MDAFDMLIAQHSVAGEVHTRPAFPDRSAKSDDQQALDEFACDRSNLPWVIFRAAHRAAHISALPARARSLLAALARTVDAARPYAAIFARRDLLTGRALQSMRTFYRSLDDLETAGFITRPPQTRYGAAGLFGRAYLHLTPKVAGLLGLVEEKQAEATRSETAMQEQASSDSCDPLLSRPSATLAHRAIYKDLSPHTQKRQPARLPDDLIRLRSLGFREFLIFKLMREARSHGKLLSDVVEATWTHLQKARHPISYLRSLLTSPVDFAYRVRSKHVDENAKTLRQAEQIESDKATKDLGGRTFKSADGSRQYVVSDDATSVSLYETGQSRPRVKVGKWIPDFLRALRSGQVVAEAAGAAGTIIPAPPPRTKSTDVSRAHMHTLKHLLKPRSTAATTHSQPLAGDMSNHQTNSTSTPEITDSKSLLPRNKR
jgi:hypothetical protein